MSTIQINTSQNVIISYDPATLGDRMLAWLIDVIVIGLWLALVAVFTFEVAEFDSDISTIVFVFAGLVPISLYHVVSEVLTSGQSIGKKILKIKVVQLNGEQASIGSYAIRWAMRLFEFTLFLGLGLLVYLYLGKNQRVGDLLAGTTVIKIKPKVALEDTILGNVSSDYQPQFPQVQFLTHRDIETIKEVLNNDNAELKYTLYNQASDHVKNVLGIETEMVSYDFLSQLVSDFNFYQSKMQ